MSTSRRLLAVAGFAAATALILTGCAGEPSPVTKAIADSAAPKTVGTTISKVSPATGSVSGGQITISGKNLGTVKSVEIGGQTAALKHTSSSKVVATVPAAENFQAGAVDLSLNAANGKTVATRDNAYTYAVTTPVDRQLNYAMTYWKNYNTAAWGDLNPVGGDCANFVSQTLIARGWTQNAEWYNKNAAADWSPAWGYVPAMDNYFTANAATLGLTEYPLDQRAAIKVGDIVMFDWNNNDSLDHVQIVSAVEHVNGKIEIKMAGHNEDTDYRDLDTTITVDHPGATGHFWSLSK
ncbi:amidase domain-containing protein [Leifsonia poae]|uniref:amidase domain-containing protein n=1 Tax=Leifsonia poae TaxID=110933 RepID=UPI001CBC897A|nr:amidase domain-containing protein [Leifsonia poae]